MIKKFIKITGTGRFLNYSHNTTPAEYRASNFEKVNLIYGENGSGKTTLSIILQSLKGDNALLQKKKAFGENVQQEIAILALATANQSYIFGNNAWNKHMPDIEVFDIHFINQNIFTGLEIQNIHKKNLFEVIFGSQGVCLKEEIKRIKDNIQKANSAFGNTSNELHLKIGDIYSPTEYINKEADPQIDAKIAAKQAQINTAKRANEIRQKTPLSELPRITVPFDNENAKALCAQSISSISEQYLQKFKEHKEHLSMDGKEEEWLKKGYAAIQDKKCPFCQRTLDETVDIIEAYKQYFNQEYERLLTALNELNSNLEKLNLDTNFLRVDGMITLDNGLIDFWKAHLTGEPLLTSLNNKKEELVKKLQKAKNAIAVKLKDPIHEAPSTDLTTLLNAITALNTTINEYNEEIREYNTRIKTLKSTPSGNVSALENEFKQLEAIKKKEDPTIKALCEKLLADINIVGALNTQKDTKQRELDTHTTTIFEKYLQKINEHLQRFAAYLEIRNFSSGYVGTSKDPMVKYALYISGNEIVQEDSSVAPTFKYSLSEGDKSALALAFFLAKLEVDGNIQDKIIVFDDPLSSFDLNRKNATISNLTRLAQQAKQLFVFTHNIVFACDFWKGIEPLQLTSNSSKIEYIGNTSCIVEFNIGTEALSSVLKDSTAVKNYLQNGAITDGDKRSIARCLRPALESYFYLKFYGEIGPNEWLGNFIERVRNATAASDPFFRLKDSLNDLTEINDYSKKYHHRLNAGCESKPVNDAELRNYCDRTLKLIQVI